MILLTWLCICIKHDEKLGIINKLLEYVMKFNPPCFPLHIWLATLRSMRHQEPCVPVFMGDFGQQHTWTDMHYYKILL
jgi:hypothetical protein